MEEQSAKNCEFDDSCVKDNEKSTFRECSRKGRPSTNNFDSDRPEISLPGIPDTDDHSAVHDPGKASATENGYEQVTRDADSITLTKFSKVVVMEGEKMQSVTEDDCEDNKKSNEEFADDEDLSPALRFVCPGNVVDLSEGSQMTSFEWYGTQGQKVTVLTGLEGLVNLKNFCLRSNFIRETSGLSTLTKLVWLELYENRINSIKGLENLVNLENLDLSYNRLRVIDPDVMGPLVNLKKLHIAENKLEKIQGLGTLRNLEILDLGMNRISKIEGLDSLVSLRELWLGKNRIEKMEGLCTLLSLVRLSVQNNRLRRIGNGLESLIGLEELYLSHQGISGFEGLDNLVNLSTIDLSNNVISSFDGLPVNELIKLEDLWMSYNNVASFQEIEKLRPLGNILQTIYLDHNPIATEFEYRIRLGQVIPSLKQIDANPR